VRLESTRRGLLRWVYRTLPGKGTDPELIIAYTRDASGEWRVSRTAENYSPEFLGIGYGSIAPPGGAGARVLGQSAAGVSSGFELAEQLRLLSEAGRSLLIDLDLGQATSVPGPGSLGAGIVTAAEFLNRFPLTPRFDFLKAEDGNTFVRAGVSAPAASIYADEDLLGERGSFLFLYAAYTPESGSGETLYARNETDPTPVPAGVVSNPGSTVETWVSRTLPPGAYDVSLGLQDAATGSAGSLRQRIVVPDLAKGAPAISSIIPVTELGRLGEDRDPTPRISGVFRRSEEFGIYYQIYNLVTDEDRRSFDVTYRFLLRSADEEKPIGKPIAYSDLSQPVQGWSIPLGKWPPGAYRLEVTVQDRIGTGQAVGSVDFEVR
jgi:hypothetical protein